MTPDTPETNTQSGIPLTDAETERPDLIATGDRRGDVHYEADPDQLVKVRSLTKPEGPIPPEGDSETPIVASESGPIEDILVPPASPSVWDARPPADEGDSAGH